MSQPRKTQEDMDTDDEDTQQQPSTSKPKDPTKKKTKRVDDRNPPPVAEKRIIIVDPTTGEELPDPKRAKIDLNEDIKIKCLTLLVSSYNTIYHLLKLPDTASANLTVSHQITSIIFTLHNYNRQLITKPDSNLITKTQKTDFKVTHRGEEYILLRKSAFDAWKEVVNNVGLEYKKFDDKDKENWIGTIGPYLNFSSAWGLRVNELRIGHQKMPIGKDKDGNTKMCFMSRYGLSGAHQILLEGNTYPPERRASMAQSIGPMTAFLSMIKSENIYRAKWENAVKKMMSHIGSIDDIIMATRNVKDPAILSPLLSVLSDILLITTTRQTQRCCFPLVMLSAYFYVNGSLNKERMKNFNCSGAGAFHAYKSLSMYMWRIDGDYTEEQASQVVFHGIFGTYKEDLSLLEQITTTKNWYNREQLAVSFKKTKKETTGFKLPELKYYAKMASANQSGLLSGVYTQVSSLPCFSGNTVRTFTDDFYTHLKRRTTATSGGKTITQLITSLSATLEALQKELLDRNNKIDLGTKAWKAMDSLDIGKEGDDLDLRFVLSNKFFMGKKL